MMSSSLFSFEAFILFLQDLIDLTFVYLGAVSSGSLSDFPKGEVFLEMPEAALFKWGWGC